jgi:hypothetical protein
MYSRVLANQKKKKKYLSILLNLKYNTHIYLIILKIQLWKIQYPVIALH